MLLQGMKFEFSVIPFREPLELLVLQVFPLLDSLQIWGDCPFDGNLACRTSNLPNREIFLQSTVN